MARLYSSRHIIKILDHGFIFISQKGVGDPNPFTVRQMPFFRGTISKKIVFFAFFYRILIKGSHKKFRKNSRTVIVPDPRKEIPMGTFHSILKQSDLKQEDFIE